MNSHGKTFIIIKNDLIITSKILFCIIACFTCISGILILSKNIKIYQNVHFVSFKILKKRKILVINLLYRKTVDPDYPQCEHHIKELMSYFIREIENKANSFDGQDLFLNKLKLTEVANQFKVSINNVYL